MVLYLHCKLDISIIYVYLVKNYDGYDTESVSEIATTVMQGTELEFCKLLFCRQYKHRDYWNRTHIQFKLLQDSWQWHSSNDCLIHHKNWHFPRDLGDAWFDR